MFLMGRAASVQSNLFNKAEKQLSVSCVQDWVRTALLFQAHRHCWLRKQSSVWNMFNWLIFNVPTGPRSEPKKANKHKTSEFFLWVSFLNVIPVFWLFHVFTFPLLLFRVSPAHSSASQTAAFNDKSCLISPNQFSVHDCKCTKLYSRKRSVWYTDAEVLPPTKNGFIYIYIYITLTLFAIIAGVHGCCPSPDIFTLARICSRLSGLSEFLYFQLSVILLSCSLLFALSNSDRCSLIAALRAKQETTLIITLFPMQTFSIKAKRYRVKLWRPRLWSHVGGFEHRGHAHGDLWLSERIFSLITECERQQPISSALCSDISTGLCLCVIKCRQFTACSAAMVITKDATIFA